MLLWITLPAAWAATDHAAWDALLRRHVDARGRVNYQGLAKDRGELDAYLGALASAAAPEGSPADRLAFWINAYNACVVKGVLDRYPVRSVKEINGFFDKIRCQVAGAARTLNEIEAQGRALGDWRIHMAVVCASTSCPWLRPEAYVGQALEAQLTDAAQQFLRDPSRGLRIDGGTLWASSIFTWYARDFTPSWRLTPAALIAVLSPYLDPAFARAAGAARPLKFLEYDWTLNAGGP